MFIWTESIGQQDNVNDFMFEDFYEKEIERINEKTIDDPNAEKKQSNLFPLDIDKRIKINESQTKIRNKSRLMRWDSIKIG